MRHFPSLAILTFAFITSLTTGCSAPTPDEPGDVQGTGEDDITRGALVGEVGAVKINGGASVASPAKVERILANLGLDASAAMPKEGALGCAPKVRLELFGPSGELAATATFMCDANRKNAKGAVQVGGKSYLVTAKDLDAIDAIAKEPRAFADISYGADKLVFSKPFDPTARVETTDRAVIAKVRDAFQLDEVPDPKASFRCPPSRVVSFFLGEKELTSVGLSCEEIATGIVEGTLTTTEKDGPYGAVHLDVGVVLEVERTLAAAR